MMTVLKKRYGEWRLIETSILNYLHNPEAYFASAEKDNKFDVFTRPNREETVKILDPSLNEPIRLYSQTLKKPQLKAQDQKKK